MTALFSPPEVNLNVTATGTLALVAGRRAGRSLGGREPDLRLAAGAGRRRVRGSLLTLDGSSVGSQKALEGGRVRLRFTRATGVSGSGVIAAVVFKGAAPGTAPSSVESLSLERERGVDRSRFRPRAA